MGNQIQLKQKQITKNQTNQIITLLKEGKNIGDIHSKVFDKYNTCGHHSYHGIIEILQRNLHKF